MLGSLVKKMTKQEIKKYVMYLFEAFFPGYGTPLGTFLTKKMNIIIIRRF